MVRSGLVVIILAGGAASLFANFPGHFSPDSLWQLAQGRSGVFNEWHPPVMAWILGVLDRIEPGAGLFIVLDGALFFGGLLALVLIEDRPRPISLPLAALLVASPIVLIYQGVVWKDVLFADASVAGFAALGWSGRAWRRVVWRYALLTLAFTLFALASLSRQNGWVVVLCGAAALCAIRLTAPGPRRALSATHGLVALALVALVWATASWALAARDDGKPETARQVRRLQVFDLAGAARADPGLDLSILRREAPQQEEFIRRRAAPAWTAAGADNLKALPGAAAALAGPGRATDSQWRALLLRRPILYLRTRGKVFSATLLTPAADACPMTYAGVDGEFPQLLARAGLRARYDDKDEWDEDYEGMFLSTPIFSHVFFGALLVALLIWIARDMALGDRRPATWAMAAMGLSALLFTASFFVISSACDYRYLYFLDLAAMAVLIRQAGRRPLHRALLRPSSA